MSDKVQNLKQDLDSVSRALIEAIPDMLFRCDAQGRIFDFSPGTHAAPYVPPEQFLGKCFSEVLPADVSRKIAMALRSADETGRIQRTEYALEKDGRRNEFEARTSKIADNDFLVIVRDITERMVLERQLVVRENQYRRLLDALGDNIHVVNSELKVWLFNASFREWARRLMLDENPIGRYLFEVFPFLPKTAEAEYHKVFQSGQPLVTTDAIEFRGEYFVTETRKVPMIESGVVTHVVTVIRDITEKWRAEKARSELDAMRRRILESANDAIIVTDVDTGTIVEANPSAARLLGRSQSDLMGLHQIQVVAEQEHESFLDWMESHRDMEVTSTETGTLVHRDGHEIPVEVSVSMIDDEGDRLMIGIYRDISERLRAKAEKKDWEARLRQQQKLESLGTLAGGVAHEINNPINIIMNYGQLILDRRSNPDRVAEYTSEIISESDRIAGIVRNLLAFARQDRETWEEVGPREVIESTVGLMRKIMTKSQIGIHLEIETDLPAIACRKQQIQQVLMNLMTNARDALNQRFPTFDERKQMHIGAHLIDGVEGPMLRMFVKDYGVGIAEDLRERIFDPFFTSKSRDQGTGLGLSVSHGIASEHGGRLHFETEVGAFTCFYLDLPLEDGFLNDGGDSDLLSD